MLKKRSKKVKSQKTRKTKISAPPLFALQNAVIALLTSGNPYFKTRFS